MSNNATIAAISGLLRIRAATEIVQNVNLSPEPSGWKIAKPNCSIPNTSTSFLPCRKKSPRSPFRTRQRCTNILFHATAETLQTIAADPRHLGAEIGFFAVMHSWGQNLSFHPHLHCVVPGGGLSPDGTQWISCRPGCFLPVRVLSMLFRRLFLQAREKAFNAGELQFFSIAAAAPGTECVPAVSGSYSPNQLGGYAKSPFAGPEQVLEYVGVIHIGSQFPTIACATSKTARCASGGRTIARATSKRR